MKPTTSDSSLYPNFSILINKWINFQTVFPLTILYLGQGKSSCLGWAMAATLLLILDWCGAWAWIGGGVCSCCSGAGGCDWTWGGGGWLWGVGQLSIPKEFENASIKIFKFFKNNMSQKVCRYYYLYLM